MTDQATRSELRRLYGRMLRRLPKVVIGYSLLWVAVICVLVLIAVGTSWFIVVGASWTFMSTYLEPWWAKALAVAIFHTLSLALLEFRRHRPDLFGWGEVTAAWLVFWQALSLAPNAGLTVAIAIGGAVYLCIDGVSHVRRRLSPRAGSI